MKKNHLFMLKKMGGIIFISFVLFFSSCADGYDGNSGFSSGVTDSQLESPDASGVTVTSVPNQSTGKTDLKFTWPVVYGAGGYSFTLYNVDDPDNPVVLGEENQFVDGCSVQRERADDTKYKIVIKTLGNAALNNIGSTTATEVEYTTLIQSTAIIPSGTDLAVFFEQNPIKKAPSEQVYELVAGGSYTISKNIDFADHQITLRGDKVNHPKVVIEATGGITIMAGFKLRFMDVDCSAMTSVGVVTMSGTPADSLRTIKDDNNRYLIMTPIVFESSNFKGVNESLFYGNKQGYVLKDVQVMDCIVQLNNSDKEGSVINCSGNNYNCIKDFVVVNSTFYNLNKNSKAYFLRFGNASNAQPHKIGFADGTASVSITNNTFYQVMTGKNFGDQIASHNKITTTMRNNIFYDCFRVNRVIGGSNQKLIDKATNFLWGVTNPVDGTDKNYGTEENPNFSGPVDQDPDAVNFAPTNSAVLERGSGDPRWLP